MGEELHFYILAQDNNTYENNISRSQLHIARFPSLENIFSDIESYEKDTEEWMEDIKESIEDISEITEDIKFDLLKSDEVTWEEKQKLENTFTEIEDIASQIEEIKENIEKIIEQASDNNIFDKNLLEKFGKFQISD